MKKNTVIILLAVAILGSWGYLLVNSNKEKAVQDQNVAQITQVTNDKGTIQKSFDESLVRLDSMSSISNTLKNSLSADNKEIAKRKTEIRRILNKKNATAAELAQAQAMIAQLNDQISTMEQKVATLTQDNQGLTADNQVLTQDKQKLTEDLTTTTTANAGLAKEIDIASTLNASNIAITPVDVKKDGKEKVTTTAKRVNKLIISFDVANRIAQSGNTDVYVCVTGPDGKNIVVPALNSGTFTTRDQGDIAFTTKVPVQLDSAQLKKVSFGFAPGASFQQGSYKIQIYQNGFMIGEGTRELKKGGLFS
jgi:peptidoglycan hydrolase CwlO-like protein